MPRSPKASKKALSSGGCVIHLCDGLHLSAFVAKRTDIFSRINHTIKKSFFSLLLISSLIKISDAQQPYRVIDWSANTTLYKYIDQKLHAQYEYRDSVLEHALYHKSLAAYQAHCRKNYFKILGDFPPKTPLHAQITGTIQEDGYRIQKIIYESFPHHHVTGNLYIPNGKGPFPGVLFFCGHEATAKATITYQQTAILFAKYGFVVLEIDPISQGERYQLTDSSGKPLTRGGTTAHTLLASGSNLVGTSVVAYELWDNERGLDYLSSLKEVDTSRLGCLGNSGGGTQTAYFIPCDKRIKVAAICSYTTRRERTLELLGPQDGCQWLPNESNAGLDISDYAIMFAPKPLLILSGRYDFVDFNGTLDVYTELKRVYDQLGHPDKVKLFTYDDGHGIQKPKQEVAVQWFRRWLYHDDAEIKEGVLNTLSAQQLDATLTGQVNTTFRNEITVPLYNLMLANQWRERRKALLRNSTREGYQNMLRKLLCIDDHSSSVDTQQMGIIVNKNYTFQKLILRKQGEPPLPCFLACNEKKSVHQVIIILNKDGKEKAVKNDSLINLLYQQGDAVLLADLRGIGETSDEPSMNDHKYDNVEYRNAMLSLFTGMPLPGQRAEDIFTLLNFIRTYPDLQKRAVKIYASGPAAEAALFASALDPHIDKIILSDTILSFYQMLKCPVMKNQYAYVVPDVLRYFDLPDLVSFIGPTKVRYEK